MKELIRTFNFPLCFSCLQNCGLCCSYKVHLSTEDLKRINGRLRNYDDGNCLPKKDGFCCFLDKDSRCIIYKQRPRHCRTFPFYVESSDEIDVDLSCPGIGYGRSLNEDYFIEFTGVNETRNVLNNGGIDELFTLTGGFNSVSRDSFRRIGLDWCSNLKVKDGCGLADIIKLAQAQSQTNASLGTLDEIHEFIIPGEVWNTHFDTNKKLIRYYCRAEKSCLTIDQKVYHFHTENLVSLTKNQLDFICQYIELWFSRILFYRFCVVTSLQAPMISSPLNVAFGFIAGLVEQIGHTRNILVRYWSEQGEDICNFEILKESIRLFDGRLRTKCRASTVQVCNNAL